MMQMLASLNWDELRNLPWWQAFLGIFVIAFILVNFVAVYVGMSTYLERKIAAHMQSRVGPYRMGPHGILVWIADAVKLMTKEDIVPTDTDHMLFRMAPYVVFAGSFACFVALPFTVDWSPAVMNVGILYILALSSAVVLGILMAGWSSGSKWALFGAMRSAAQIVSYEVPVGLTVLAMLLIYGTLDMQKISAMQATGGPWGFGPDWHGGIFSWGLFRHLPFTIFAGIAYYVGALAETNRTPFDIPEAESELVAGFHTEYSGMRFSFFSLSEYANMFTVSAICTTLFLGGWLPPFGRLLTADDFFGAPGSLVRLVEGLFWFMSKSFFLIFVMMWLRWTLPRYRVDQLMDLCWKKLTPLAFINLAGVAIGEYNKWAGLAVGLTVLGLLGLIMSKEILSPPPKGELPAVETAPAAS